MKIAAAGPRDVGDSSRVEQHLREPPQAEQVQRDGPLTGVRTRASKRTNPGAADNNHGRQLHGRGAGAVTACRPASNPVMPCESGRRRESQGRHRRSGQRAIARWLAIWVEETAPI